MQATRTAQRWAFAVGCLGLLAAAVAGCSDADRSTEQPRAPAGVSLSFVQLRIDEGTDRAQLRVVNGSGSDLTVTGVGLDWPGYGEFLDDYDTVVVAGRVLDLRVTLPEPRCEDADPADADDAAVVGQLRVGVAGHDVVVRDELDESGRGYVTRIWQRRCQDLLVARSVTMSYGGHWAIEGSGRRARLVGTVTLRREQSAGTIRLRGFLGSVLLEPHLPRPVVLTPGADEVTAPLEIVVPRCDEHALTESSQTFHLQASFRFGADEPVQVLRLPGARTREAAQRLIDEACVIDGSAE
ncbi:MULTISPECIES: hypothetical protein [unclassified Nocardioides]|uniref:hypothetical protein n=1 Tax=unclassified Nocardioides TaxID=2615069 RepID=UPI0000EB63FD|nr:MULTISPECIES: hypothetical protein [unclassified Nocardioides]ABL83862.1 hypothetical protein Noca_4365 [Nocardioides sp. JS614]